MAPAVTGDDSPASLSFDVEHASDLALIDIVVGRRGVAARLLEDIGSLAILARLTPAALAQRSGLSQKRAKRLLAALELGRRRLVEAAKPRKILCCSADIVEFFVPRIGLLQHEEMWVVGLDAASGAVGMRQISKGGVHASAVMPSDVLRAAIDLAAPGFLLVHNHPSGNPAPSDADRNLTKTVALAAKWAGISFLDHVIVTASGRYSSIAEQYRAIFAAARE